MNFLDDHGHAVWTGFEYQSVPAEEDAVPHRTGLDQPRSHHANVMRVIHTAAFVG